MRGLELNDHLTEVHAEFLREDQVRVPVLKSSFVTSADGADLPPLLYQRPPPRDDARSEGRRQRGSGGVAPISEGPRARDGDRTAWPVHRQGTHLSYNMFEQLLLYRAVYDVFTDMAG